jgi:5'-3' exonuclease
MCLHLSLASVNQAVRRHGIDHVIFCLEGRSWRKDFYKPYKANRKLDESAMTEAEVEENKMFWETYEAFTTFLREKTNTSVIRNPIAEADDIIGAICNANGSYLGGDKILIVSGDKDFTQLQKYSNISQYSPIAKKFINPDVNPERFKQYHILQGDSGDGIPNFLSADDTFVSGGRQKPLPKKKLEEWTLMEPASYCTGEMLRNYHRNKMMIDLDCVPEELQSHINTAYNEYQRNARSMIFPYFIKHRLRNLTEAIGEF